MSPEQIQKMEKLQDMFEEAIVSLQEAYHVLSVAKRNIKKMPQMDSLLNYDLAGNLDGYVMGYIAQFGDDSIIDHLEGYVKDLEGAIKKAEKANGPGKAQSSADVIYETKFDSRPVLIKEIDWARHPEYSVITWAVWKDTKKELTEDELVELSESESEEISNMWSERYGRGGEYEGWWADASAETP